MAALAQVAALNSNEEPGLFLHRVADSICGRSTDLPALYPAFLGDSPLASVSSAAESLLKRLATSDDVEGDAGKEEMGGCTESVVEVALARGQEIRAALVADTVRKVSRTHLADFDWSVRVVVASDHISGVRRPLLVLRLYLTRVDGTKEEVTVELPREDLDGLLETFEAINKAVTQLKTY